MSYAVPTVYLAGPSIFFADWRERSAVMHELCRAHGAEGLYPADVAIEPADEPFITGQRIFAKDRALIDRADSVVADLTPFRGVSADVGTVWEIGYAFGRGKPVAAYSSDRRLLHERVLVEAGQSIEQFGMGDNLMLAGCNVTANAGHAALLARSGGLFVTFADALAAVLELVRKR